jgi:cell division protein FtsI (penicillin-binding protein 3)
MSAPVTRQKTNRRNKAERPPEPVNPERRLAFTRYRMIAVAVLLLGLLGGGVYRAWNLQIVQREHLEREAQRNYLRNHVLEQRRGEILDRNGEQLATSIRVDTIVANPRQVADPRGSAVALASVLEGVDAEAIERKLRTRSFWQYIKRRVSTEESDAVKRLDLDGILITQEWKRFYPKKEVGGQVLGRVGLDAVGLEGIERALDPLLLLAERADRTDTGEPGADASAPGLEKIHIPYIKDVKGHAAYTSGLPSDLAPEGYTVQLTLDEKIQAVVEESLRRAMVTHNAKAASAIVMSVATGEILAMANVPGFNPNDPGASPMEQWKNRALKDVYEPGSTFKIFSLAAVVEAGKARLQETVDIEGGRLRVGSHTIKDSHRGEDELTVRDIIGHSSNVGIAKLTARIGKTALHDALRAFGFGERTGIDFDAEATGTLSPAAKWPDINFANISFGQGVAVTLLQLVRATGAIGNDGVLMRPMLVKRVVTRDGRPIREFQPQPVRRVISGRTAEVTLDAMKACVEPGGTGTTAQIEGYAVAGKTGTAQKPITAEDRKKSDGTLKGGYHEDRWIASFVGLVPADDPALAIAVMVDEPDGRAFGGQVAAPVFREVASWSLRYLGIPPDMQRPVKVASLVADREAEMLDAPGSADSAGGEPGESAAAGPTEEPEPAAEVDALGVQVPDFLGLGLQDVVALARGAQLDVEIEGSGRAVAQSLAPGYRVHPGTLVRVSFESAIDGDIVAGKLREVGL